MAYSKMGSDKSIDKEFVFPELSTNTYEYFGPIPRHDPKIVGYFSVDKSNNVIYDHSGLKFIKNCKDCSVNFDLNRDIDGAVNFDLNVKRDSKIKLFLQYLLGQKERLGDILNGPVPSLERATIIGHNGILSTIANTPYESRDKWKMIATLHRGKIFICRLDKEQDNEWKLQDAAKKLTSWGSKFEQYILSDTPTSSPDVSVPNDENEHFYLVMTTQLSSHKLIYRAEMDGILCEPGITSPPDGGYEEVLEYLKGKKFVELKTQKEFKAPYQLTTFRKFKARKWLCQTYLPGVKTILVGLRNDDEGTVNKLKVFEVADLQESCQQFWRIEVCFNFLDKFLAHVKRCLEIELVRKHGKAVLTDIIRAPTTSLHFENAPNQNIKVTEHGPNDDVIVPDWFVESYA